MGCPVLALEVLSKIPKVTKKSGSSPLSKASSKANLNSSQPLENGTQGGLDWGSPAAPAWGGNESAGALDWSQPLVKVEDEGLKLDWGDDKEDDEDEDDDGGGLTMKKPEAETKADGGSESGGAKLQRENSQVGQIHRKPELTISDIFYLESSPKKEKSSRLLCCRWS